jgi:hypothetical protein
MRWVRGRVPNAKTDCERGREADHPDCDCDDRTWWLPRPKIAWSVDKNTMMLLP